MNVSVGGVSMNSASVAVSSLGNVLSAGPQLNSVPASGGAPVRVGVAGQWPGRPAPQLVNGPGGALTRTVPAAGGGLRAQLPPLQQQQQQQQQQLLQQQRHMLPQTSGVVQQVRAFGGRNILTWTCYCKVCLRP